MNHTTKFEDDKDHSEQGDLSILGTGVTRPGCVGVFPNCSFPHQPWSKVNIGTKSLLFGVHQFLWHPLTVWLAFRRLYGRIPNRWETLAIIVHDWGYWGKPNMDGAEGETHPQLGADLMMWLAKKFSGSPHPQVDAFRWYWFTKYHSRFCAAQNNTSPSELCWADKLSIWYEPRWFYLLRARLSGEIKEYRLNAKNRVPLFAFDKVWFDWYRGKVIEQIAIKKPATARHHIDD